MPLSTVHCPPSTVNWIALPNFVDCEVFRPVEGEEKGRLRASMGLEPDDFVIICVAALKCHHKRVDYIIREFKAAAKPDWKLILAGARTDETPSVESLARGDSRIRLMPDTPRAGMPGLLRAADVMVMGSLFEMMPIAVLEGLATGLPVITNDHPVMTWMTGAVDGRPWAVDRPPSTVHCLSSTSCGGLAIDMSRDGALATALAGLTPAWIAEHGRNARERAVAMFSKDVVIRQYVDYYKAVLAVK